MRNIDYLNSMSISSSNNLQQLGTSPDSLTFLNHHQNGSLPTPHKRKLVLHFDQHNTIQVACTLPGRRITVEEGLNNFLTSVVWGREVEKDRWEWVSREPRLTKPPDAPDAVTYFKYLEKKVVKSPDDRARLKQLTCKFVHQEPGLEFKEYFHLYLESLVYQTRDGEDEGEVEFHENVYYYTNGVTNGHHKDCIKKEKSISNGHKCNMKKLPPNTIPAGDPTNKSIYHLILPEFFDMIRRLQKADREFSIILRTMGIDSHNFLETIRPMFEGKHRDFRDLKPVKINSSVGEIKRASDDSISLHMDGEIFTTDAQIYAKLSSLEGISAIRDDFAYWQSHDYSCYAAKPLWIDLNDLEHQHIIFDDNIRVDSTIEDCIVNIRLRQAGAPENEFVPIDFELYQFFEKSSILQPDLIKLLNPHLRSDSTRNYYYDLVKKSEAVYDRLLEEREKINIYDAAFHDRDIENEASESSTPDKDSGSKEVVKMRRNSDDVRLLTYFKEKRKRNLILNRSFSMRLEEAEKQAQQENMKSTLCVVS